MTIKEILNYLEKLAPTASQESWDNCGVQTGNVSLNCSGVLVSLDCTEAIVDEAIEKGCNLIISHHPLIFKGLKSVTGKNYIERTLIKAIKNDITLYAFHTNFDVWRFGVNHEIANRLSLVNQTVFIPKTDNLVKLVIYVPETEAANVKTAMFANGAGEIGNYNNCSFETSGNGQFEPNEHSNPFIGAINSLTKVKEIKIETIVSKSSLHHCISAMIQTHPYEEVAYDIVPLLNQNNYEGLGMVGEFEKSINVTEFLSLVKKTFGGVVRYTGNEQKEIKRIALCGGSGAGFIKKAIGQKVDAYLTSDIKYHEFFDAENHLLLVDIGHFESEQFTSNRIVSLLKDQFKEMTIQMTSISSNPVKYL